MKTLLMFVAHWSAHSLHQRQLLEQIAIPFVLEIIDVCEDCTLAIKYGIRIIPTLLLLENDEPISRLAGFTTKENLELWLNAI